MSKPSLESTIPTDVATRIDGRTVRQVGFGAGPSFMIGAKKDYDPPVPLAEGFAWIERIRDSIKRAHVFLDDGTTLWFTSVGFEKYSADRKDLPPKRETLVATTDEPLDISVQVDVAES